MGMTREELKEHCERQIQQFERVEKIMPVTLNDWKRYEEHKLILELLEQKPVLDKIRAEIQNIAFDWQEIDGEHESFMVVDLNDALNIIDKYESEG